MIDAMTISGAISEVNETSVFKDNQILLKQIGKVYQLLMNIMNNYDSNVEEDYKDFYAKCIDYVDSDYIEFIPQFIDSAVFVMISEIYDAIDNPEKIKISCDYELLLSSSNRKHFKIAKEISERIIKKHFFDKKYFESNSVINYMEELLPESYIKKRDLDKVLWYFLISIISYNREILGKEF